MLTGRVIDSEEANRIGLVSNVVADEDLSERCLSVAREISRNSPFGVWMTKEVMWSNLEIPSLRAGIDMENRTQILSAGTEDSKKAMSSFLGTGEVDWKNR
jgi:enoyl-CoA hydratase